MSRLARSLESGFSSHIRLEAQLELSMVADILGNPPKFEKYYDTEL